MPISYKSINGKKWNNYLSWSDHVLNHNLSQFVAFACILLEIYQIFVMSAPGGKEEKHEEEEN